MCCCSLLCATDMLPAMDFVAMMGFAAASVGWLLGWARNHVFVVCAVGSAVLATVGFARMCCFGCFLKVF
ncbi:hypothetical protein U1Q18_019669 [Sarracenia purpurea var. burkii]